MKCAHQLIQNYAPLHRKKYSMFLVIKNDTNQKIFSETFTKKVFVSSKITLLLLGMEQSQTSKKVGHSGLILGNSLFTSSNLL